MTRLERSYPRRRTLGAVACLQCLLLQGVPGCSPPDRTCPGHSSAYWRIATTSRFLEGHSSGSAQEPGETRPSPFFAPGHWTMPCGHWPFRPRGGVLPVLRDSDSKWREHDEQVSGRVAAVVHGVTTNKLSSRVARGNPRAEARDDKRAGSNAGTRTFGHAPPGAPAGYDPWRMRGRPAALIEP